MRKIEKEGNLSATFNEGGQTIKVSLSIIVFNEDDMVVYYCPALDLYGYGKTEAEADASLQVSMSEYFRYATNKRSLIDDLRALGWNVRSKSKPFTPPLLNNLLTTNVDLRNIFDHHPFRKMDRCVDIPLVS